jgi:Tol biopolymer transport system component
VKRLVLTLALALLFAGCGSSQTENAENGPIVWTAAGSRLGHGLVRRDPNGERRRITDGLRDYYPTWSPDGERIAFVRPFGKLGLSHLFVMDADGGDLHQVGSVATDTNGLSWSPDGSRIAFGDGRGISTVGMDGTGLEKLTSNGTSPAWSADGKTIVFVRLPADLFAMDDDGGNIRRLISARAPEGSQEHLYSVSTPAWSRDGGQILFVRTDILRQLEPDAMTIQVADADGRNARAVIAIPFTEPGVMRPSWSPDGRQIVFAGRRDERHGIWAVRTSGGEPQLIAEGVTYAMPSWGPRGT